jgi:CheY-like chemotaxis protein
VIPDLVLMDVFLPRVDGLDAAAALKAAPATRDIPVILVSAHRGVADKVRALQLGAVDHLAKPFKAADLLARVEAALAARAPVLDEGARTPIDDSAAAPLDAPGFLRRLAQELSRSRRYGHSLALLSFRFADATIPRQARTVAELRAGLRAGDVVGAPAAGCLAACLPRLDLPGAQAVAARLQTALRDALGSDVDTSIADLSLGEASAEEALGQLLVLHIGAA